MKAFIERIDRTNVRSVFVRAWKHAANALKVEGAFEIVIRRATKSRDQEEHYHALIGDIAEQYDHAGRRWHKDDMKRLLVDAFKHDTKDDPDLMPLWVDMGDLRLVPAIGRDGFVPLGEQTRRFPVKLASAFIDWLYAFGYGCEPRVIWSDKKWEIAAAQWQQMREAA